VSLKDAYESGASSWSASKKKIFANDRSNHVPSCSRVNTSKGSGRPSDFLRKSRDGKGFEYEIVRFCEYVKKYYAVKVKYELSFASNDENLFCECESSQLYRKKRLLIDYDNNFNYVDQFGTALFASVGTFTKL